MRIVDRKTFLALPPNTLYQKYADEVLNELFIKYDSLPDDWLAMGLAGMDALGFDRMVDEGKSEPVEFFIGQDREIAEDQLFAIWEPDDIRGLVAKLVTLLPCDQYTSISQVTNGVVIEYNDRYWGVISGSTGHDGGTTHGWTRLDKALISDPRYCKKPEDVTYAGSPDITELRKGRLLPVKGTVTTEVYPG